MDQGRIGETIPLQTRSDWTRPAESNPTSWGFTLHSDYRAARPFIADHHNPIILDPRRRLPDSLPRLRRDCHSRRVWPIAAQWGGPFRLFQHRGRLIAFDNNVPAAHRDATVLGRIVEEDVIADDTAIGGHIIEGLDGGIPPVQHQSL